MFHLSVHPSQHTVRAASSCNKSCCFVGCSHAAAAGSLAAVAVDSPVAAAFGHPAGDAVESPAAAADFLADIAAEGPAAAAAVSGVLSPVSSSCVHTLLLLPLGTGHDLCRYVSYHVDRLVL